MKLGAMTRPARTLDAEITWIGQNGFDFVDLRMEAPGAALEKINWRTVGQQLRAAELGVVCQAAAYLPTDSPSPLVRQAALDELRRSIDAAQLVGASLCITHFHGWPAYLADQEGYDYTKQLYDVLLKHGAERGVAVALENSPRNLHQLKYFRQIFHRLPTLKLAYNIGHSNINTNATGQTREHLFAFAERLAHVRLSDNDGRAAQYLPPGAASSGGIDLAHELRTLRSFQYDGAITLQIDGDRHWLLASAAWVRELWAQVV